MPTPSPKLGLALPSQPDDFSTADLRANWEKIDAAPGTFICTSTTRPTWGANQAGRQIYEVNTGVTRAWTGTTWRVEGYEPGDIKVSARATPNDGWLACDGSTRNRSTYSHLFAAIGTAFNTGGEAATDFRLPDLRGRFIIGRNPTTGQPYNVLGQRSGSTTAALTAGNLPPHAHSMTHGHTMNHAHSMDHAHTMNHTHTMEHSHSMSHTHSMNHGHSATSTTIDTNHSHTGVTTSDGSHAHIYSAPAASELNRVDGGSTVLSNVFTNVGIGGGGHSHNISTYGIHLDSGRYHTPAITVNAHNGNVGSFSGNTGGNPSSSGGASPSTTGTLDGNTGAFNGVTGTFSGNTGDGPGSGSAFSIMPPSLTMSAFIKI